MSLLTYQDARPWAKGIKAKVKVVAKEMPPWFADPRYGTFRNKRGLTQEQINTLVAWADAGAPQGAGAAPVAVNVLNDSQAGTLPGMPTRPPDAVVGAPVEMHIPAEGGNSTGGNYIWGKPPFSEDKYIEAAELRPSNRAVTHHSQVGASPLPRGAHHLGIGPAWPGGPLVNAIPVQEDGSPLPEGPSVAAEREEATANTEGFSLETRLLFYAPGAGTTTYAPGLVKVFHRDDYTNWSLHYNATGRPETDRHTLRLWFATTPPKNLIKSGTVNQVNIYEGQELIGRNVKRANIPAHAENYRVSSVWGCRTMPRSTACGHICICAART